MHSGLSAYERYPEASNRPIAKGYQRREPEKTVLYGIVQRNLKSCLSQAQERSEHGYGYPRFVEREFKKFLDCGRLRQGFVRVKCAECPSEKLVAFSCKCRGFCPSCTARRMANTAAHLVDNVLPALPYRQWVLSFPKRVRFLLACDHELLSRVLDMALRKIFAWQKRVARRLGVENPMCGAIGFVQRFGSLLNMNVHFHNLLPDGVFVRSETGVLFRPIPPPWKQDVERLNEQIARGTEKLISKHAEQRDDDNAPHFMAVEQAKSLANRFLQGGQGAGSTSPNQRSSFLYGYSLHSERSINCDDRQGLEKLCRYAARAPIANSGLSVGERGEAILKLKRPLQDGRTELRFTQIELLRKLAILIPPPRKNLTRYFGVFAPAHRDRAAVVAMGRDAENRDAEPTNTVTPPGRTRGLSWAELLKRVFAIDILKCDECGGPMKILAVIPKGEAAEAILDHLGIETWLERAIGPPKPTTMSLS